MTTSFSRLCLFSLVFMCSGVPSQHAFAKHYLLTVVQASIAPHKSQNKQWDFGLKSKRLPDVYVVINTGKSSFRTNISADTLAPRWGFGRIFRLAENAVLTIRVYDKDLRKDDLIGEVTVPISTLKRGGQQPLSFQKVKGLLIRVEEVPIGYKMPPRRIKEPSKAKKKTKSKPRSRPTPKTP